jgi:hypothetical protein
MNEPGPQFKRLFRGITTAGETDVDAFDRCKKDHEHTVDCLGGATIGTTNLNRLGIHWSDDKSAARRHVGSNGLLLEAYVHNRHIIDRDSDEGKNYSKQYRIYGYDAGVPPEKEVTIRKDSPVHIVSAEEHRAGTRKGLSTKRLEEFKAPLGGLT